MASMAKTAKDRKQGIEAIVPQVPSRPVMKRRR